MFNQNKKLSVASHQKLNPIESEPQTPYGHI